MLGIEVGRKIHLDIFAFHDARKLLGGFRMGIDHLLAKLFHGIRLTFIGGEFAGLYLVHVAHCCLLHEIERARCAAPN